MNKFLQTILFFALVTTMVTFIYSALRPAQYLAESEFLVISENIENTCDKNLGSALARIIEADVFWQNLQAEKMAHGSSYKIKKNQLRVKNYRDSNIVNVKIAGSSLAETQRLSEEVKKGVLSLGNKYYAVKDKIRIKTLIDSKIIRTPRVIIENVIKAFFGGIILGIAISLTTGLRLEFLKNEKNKNNTVEYANKKQKKGRSVVMKRSKKNDYTTIIKKRLEKELSKRSTNDLGLDDEGYVFEKTTNIRQPLSETKLSEKNDFEKVYPKVKVISASTMIVGKHDKKIKEDRAPDNLPIFIEEKLPKEDDRKKTKGQKHGEFIVGEEEKSPEKMVGTKEGSVAKKKIPRKDNGSKSERIERENKDTSMPGIKRASAHDIANGFAPSPEKDNGPTNEEIKDRLNKLLRGEL